MIFTIFSGRRVFCTQAMKNCCSLEFIHWFSSTQEQRYSVKRIKLKKTWMTLKLTKILVSLLVMNPLKKNDKGSDDPEYDPKFLH